MTESQYQSLPFEEKIISSLPKNRDRKGPPEILPEEIEYDEEKDILGEGYHGKVFKGRCRRTEVAIKVPHMQNLSERELQNFRNEIETMSKIFHPNVVLFLGASTSEGQIKIVTELMSSDLEALLHSKAGRRLPLHRRLNLAVEASKGMNWLHGICNVIHRDLKPANLLVDRSHKTVKVTDFGFSETFMSHLPNRDLFGRRGTAIWMAPEVMCEEDFNEKIDVYAFGIILWEIYSLEEPFSEYTRWEDFSSAICFDKARPPIDKNCPESLRLLMERCWDEDPDVRPSFSEIIFRLQECIVDVLIDDPAGRDFWKTHFLLPRQSLEISVDGNQFLEALTEYTGQTSDAFTSVISFCYTDPKNMEGNVSVSSFNNAINWFGRFFSKDEEESSFFLEQAWDINRDSNLWFKNAFLETKECGSMVQSKIGTYIIRLSVSKPDFPFTLSVVTKGKSGSKVSHWRIQKHGRNYEEVKYTCKTQTRKVEATSITELIDILKEGSEILLTEPWAVQAGSSSYLGY
eukprot:TRINITY_DN11748_c0_g1_i1.p1 TRINITY_DN11748_c0_g1~~TRINITY_DN11748_c0_g1_i1.p1  ORF type:complete len:517 (+),score=91.27 TRINITY_DN11748_c0_g1_i1:6-1556(+)